MQVIIYYSILIVYNELYFGGHDRMYNFLVGSNFFSFITNSFIRFFIDNNYANVKKLIYASVILLVCFLLKKIVIKYTFNILRGILNKIFPGKVLDLFVAFEKPLNFIITALGFYISIGLFVQGAFLNKLFRSIVIICIFKGLVNFSNQIIVSPNKMKDKFGFEVDNILFPFLCKCIKVVIITFGITIVFAEWGINVQMLITGLGIGGLAISLAAKDAAANVISGVILIIDKPFGIGDWIAVDSIEGSVEELSFRSTKIRTISQEIVIVPNSNIASSSIVNFTKRGKRRCNFTVGIAYETEREKIEGCISNIEEMLKASEDIISDGIIVTLDSLNSSSIDINISCYTRILDLALYLKLKEKIYLNILDILKKQDVSIPYPTTTVYLKNNKAELKC